MMTGEMPGNGEVVLKRFDAPDEVQRFDRGEFSLVRVGGSTIGQATYPPGWKWSTHVGKHIGRALCEVEHVVLVVSGRLIVEMRNGRQFLTTPGDIVYIPPGHDSWVVGDERYISLHLLGSAEYGAQH
jgi:quercetin dioxygenase-like cupin family protein